MKTLLLLNGPMGVGKSAVCRALSGRITPSVYLDGDWCWSMNPFRVTDETREMVMDNITAMLSRFLAYLPLYAAQRTIKIMTDELDPRQTAEAIAGQIESG